MFPTSEMRQKIDAVFAAALAEDRQTLYEYEVYEILRALGLSVPTYHVTGADGVVTAAEAAPFGEKLVLKVISPDIAHKQKVGGVQVLDRPTAATVQSAIETMKADIGAHYTDGAKPLIKGFLLTEFLHFAQGIGYETLMGIKSDPAFGPLLTVSKGGDDAEFFAKYYDPANLIMPPLDEAQALAFVHALNIRHKFENIGHPEYIGLFTKAVTVLSQFAYAYSAIAPEKPVYVVTEMDINPFVITSQGQYVAVDGFARFQPASQANFAKCTPNTRNLTPFFQPQGIAVIGVSANLEKDSMGREIAHLLHDLGRRDIYPVNPRGGTLRFDDTDYPIYSQIADIPQTPQLAIYAAPAQHFVDFLKHLPKDGPKSIIVISGIPSDMSYPTFQAQIDEVLPPDTRIIGPNCVGVFHAPDAQGKGVNSIFISKEKLQILHAAHSNVALITQSGALAISVIDKMKESRLFRSVVSIGNKYDVKTPDLIAYFNQQPDIHLIALYVEGMTPNEGRSFFELARESQKPILVYKSGKTEAGAKAAASHTASMSGSYEVFKAACAQSGIILGETLEDFETYLKIFSLLSTKTVRGNRVAGVLNAGFESTVGADELNHLTQAKLAPETLAKLKALDEHGLVDLSTSFLDITPSSGDRVFAGFVETLLQDEGVDCVFVAAVPHANALKSDPITCHDPDSMANLITALSAKYQKPVVVSINGGEYYTEFAKVFEQGGLPVYGDIRSAMKALDTFVAYHLEPRRG